MPTNRRGADNRKIYGSRKDREMARSVLPSTGRRAARADLDRTRRHARRSIAMELTRYRGPAVPMLHAALDDEADLTMWPSSGVREVVSVRRAADKIAPLIRWAGARTRDLPQAERLDAVRRVLPAGVIGTHALSHLAWWGDFRNPAEPLTAFEIRLTEPSVRRDLAAELRVEVRAALEDGRHGELNQWLKRRSIRGTHVSGVLIDPPARLLGGEHDVEAFCADAARGRAVLRRRLLAHLREPRPGSKPGTRATSRSPARQHELATHASDSETRGLVHRERLDLDGWAPPTCAVVAAA